MDATSIALRLISLVADLWPSFGTLLNAVSEHPDFTGDSVAAAIAASLPKRGESEEAAERLRG